MCLVVVKVAIWSAGTTDTWLSRIWSFSRMKLILFLDKIRTQDSHTLKRICVIPVRAQAPLDLVYIVHKLLPVQIFFLLLLSSWWAALTASGKTHSGNNKTQNDDVLFRAWSLQSIFSQTLAGKAKRAWNCLCHAVIMFQSSAIPFATTVDYRECTDQQWKTEPGCFLLGRLCLNILLWKRVSGRTHSVANRSLFSKQSSKSVLSSVQETSISVQCQFSISDSCVPLRVPETHTMCQFCCRGFKNIM